jgi:Bacterial inner membrane protein
MNWIGWVATAISTGSYMFRHPVALRWTQAASALLWIAYGLAIGAPPVMVANVIVAVAAVYSSLRISRSKKAAGA